MSESGRRGRRKKELVPDGGPVTAFAMALRELRAQAGNPPYRSMAERVHVAHNLLSQADAGHRLPTEEALVAYVSACGGDVDEWKQKLYRARAAQAETQDTGGEADVAPVGPEPHGGEPRGPSAPQDIGARPDAAAEVGEAVPPPAGWQLAKRRIVVAGVAAATALVIAATIGWVVTASGDTTAGATLSRPRAVSHETFGSVADARCRPAWAPMSDGVHFLPCIEHQPDGLVISAQVRAGEGAPGEVTVWIWLMRVDRKLLERRRFDLTRDRSTLRYCRVSLTGDDIRTCGPFKVRPPVGQSIYATAGTVHFLHADRPPGWDSLTFAGTQSPSVRVDQLP